MTRLEEYNNFLLQKVCIAEETGLDVEIPLIKFKDGTQLKPHQRDGIVWGIRGGRRALFESWGLGKTLQQLIICDILTNKLGGKGLITCPLGVKGEFFNDARNKLGLEIEYVRTQDEVEKSKCRVLITNYERVRDGDIDPKYFTVVTLDEASVLRTDNSKTHHTFIQRFKGIKYKYVCTATPSPNDFIELIYYACFLEHGDKSNIKTRFFKRDSTKADNLIIHPHKEKEFWLWISSWALFITKPSDLGYDDTGYDLPPLQIHYHKIAVNHSTASREKDGQGRLLKHTARGLKPAAVEKRESLPARIEEMKKIIQGDPESHYIIWHDLEVERHEIMKALPKSEYNIAEVYGNQDYEIREQNVIDFSEGRIQYLATKPELSGQGCNFQYHCHKAIFLGINYKFNDFIQAIHRILRFLQAHGVDIHIIFAESEEEILNTLLEKWEQHKYLVEQMINLIRENGLSNLNIHTKLKRSVFTGRQEEKKQLYSAINNDAVPELMTMPDNQLDLIVTSIPFSNHYEYTPNYNDFGHTNGNDHFWEQMDFLSPEIYRVLKPGRIACVHVKDRIIFGNYSGDGFQSMDYFHEEASLHFRKHGFRKLGIVTIETDVVRENKQTYRLGWTEKCKDGTKIGVGCPEYVLILRKLPTDTSNAYADIPVVRSKKEFARGQWQIDARAKWNSSGDRFLTPDEIRMLPVEKINKYFSGYIQNRVYNYEDHVAISKQLDDMGKLPKSFQILDIPSGTPWVWSDVNRMLTLNGSQTQKKLNNHICPLQFDVVDRCIDLFSMPGEVIGDPFAGLFTVPVRAIKKRRKGYGIELNTESYRDGLMYLRDAEINALSPTLFQVFDQEIKEAI